MERLTNCSVYKSRCNGRRAVTARLKGSRIQRLRLIFLLDSVIDEGEEIMNTLVDTIRVDFSEIE